MLTLAALITTCVTARADPIVSKRAFEQLSSQLLWVFC